MSKVSIVCPKSQMEKVIQHLYQLGVYHIEPHKKTDDLDIGKPLERAEKLAEILVKIRALISQFEIDPRAVYSPGKKAIDPEYYELGKKCRHIYDEAVAFTETIKKSTDEIRALNDKKRILEIVRKLNLSKELLRWKSQYLDYLVGEMEPVEPAKLKQELSTVTGTYELLTAKIGHRLLVALYTKPEKKTAMRDVLARHGFTDNDLSPVLESTKKLSQHLHEMQVQLSAVHTARNQAQLKLNTLKREHAAFLIHNEHFLAEEVKKAEVPLAFGETKKSFTIRGWVPTEKLPHVVDELNRITSNRISIIEEQPTEHDTIPVKLRHNFLVKPYEFFLKLYELPNYTEIDPSLLMFITFPLFFGFMLGDVGYGLVTMLIFLILRAKLPKMRALLNIMIFASLVTIAFGFVFGEYFGFEHVGVETGEKLCGLGLCLPVHEIHTRHGTETVADFPRFLNRVHSYLNIGNFQVLSVLVIGAIVGLIHLNLALLIGFFNILAVHGFMHAFLEKISWMIMQGGVALMVLSATGILDVTLFIGGVAFGMGVVLIYLGEGAKGLVELPALFSNMLSYMRLGAVGLASVGMAVVINENLALPYFEKGGIFTLFAILILVCGHLINIGLGILGPFLHSLRLHYVEFFSKFYQGGGIPYLPFGSREEEA